MALDHSPEFFAIEAILFSIIESFEQLWLRAIYGTWSSIWTNGSDSCCVKSSIFSSGGQHVEGFMRNLNWANSSGGMSFKDFLFLALVKIMFGGVETFRRF